MEFNIENKVVKLCAEGMEHEGKGEGMEALKKFELAWSIAQTDFERFTSAHYVARHQNSVPKKLEWDQTALDFALKIKDEAVKGTLPSLYLNVGKCHEDLNDFENARKHYEEGASYFDFLPPDGYGNLIKRGLQNGMERVDQNRHS